MYWTFTISFIVIATIYAFVCHFLLKKLFQLSKDGGLRIEVGTVRTQFIVFFIGFFSKVAFYLS